MKSLSKYSFAAAFLLILTGCGDHLSKRKAASILESQIKRMPDGKLYPLPVGLIDFQVGDLKGIDYTGRCDDQTSEPSRLDQLKGYQTAGLVIISRPSPCVWHIALTPLGIRSVSSDDDKTPPPSGEYKFVVIHLAKLKAFDSNSVKQDGQHAVGDMLIKFDFTEAMTSLAKVNIFPEIDDVKAFGGNCMYDLPASQIQCKSSMAFAYVNKEWIIDRSNPMPSK